MGELMGWKDLLAKDERVDLPWLGGSALIGPDRRWALEGPPPPEPGWATFLVSGRRGVFVGPAEPRSEILMHAVEGYLVGDRLVARDARVDPDPARIVAASERVHLIEPGLDRFAPVAAGRIHESGPLIYKGPVMPSGPEAEVLEAFLAGRESVAEVRGVAPALDAAFRMECYQRAEAVRRRREAEQRRREEEQARQRAELRARIVEQLGDAEGRRQMARVDFGEAARAALAVGGAQYLDHRQAYQKGEYVVRFAYLQRRFECVCDERLSIIDAGICLTDHETDERGDTYFTLESLPSVIREADALGALVVFRHVG